MKKCKEYSLIVYNKYFFFQKKITVKSEPVGNETIYRVDTLFGQEEYLLEVFARNLTESLKISHSIHKQLVLFLGIHKSDFENIKFFKTCEKAILDFIVKDN